MFKWFKLFKGQYVGFWILGLILFVLQEMPYIVMPLLNLSSNPIMNMPETSYVLNICEKVLGILCILAMCFIVKENMKVFDIGSGISRIGFILTILILLTNYFKWMLYFIGYQSFWIMLIFIVILPPLYYTAIGLWRGNWFLLALGVSFEIVHFIHMYSNLMR